MERAARKNGNQRRLSIARIRTFLEKPLRSYYNWYGRHLLKIEAFVISGLTGSFVLMAYFSPLLNAVWQLSLAWSLVFLVFVIVHTTTFSKLVRLEAYPYEVLLIKHIRGRLLKVDVALIFFFISLVYLSTFSSAAVNSFISPVIVFSLSFIAGFSFVVYFVVLLGGISSFQETRLSLKVVLIGLKKIHKTKSAKTKKAHIDYVGALIKKHMKWFENALSSYNKTLYKTSPSRLELVDLEQYYLSVFTVAIFGKNEEMQLLVAQTEKLLSCLGKKVPYVNLWYVDLRELLTALKNIRSLETNEGYSIRELQDMVRVTSYSDRFKRFLSSQYILAVVGLLPLLDISLRIFHVI
jgi:hypothetical protein